MCQIAGGAVGLGLNTAIVASQDHLADGIALAFKIDALLALGGLAVVLLFIGDRHRVRDDHPLEHPLALRHRHRANA
jgi:hypothetical protein